MNNIKELGKVGNYNVVCKEINLSSHSGMILIKEFAQNLGIAQLIDNEIQVKKRERGYSESESILAIVWNLIMGGAHLSDLNVLRGDDGTRELLDLPQIIAPTTTGEFLRKFDIGDIHDMQRLMRMIAKQMRPHQTSDICTLDLDSSIYEQSSKRKQGSAKTYVGKQGYHPIFCFWAEEGELLKTHLLRGNRNPIAKINWFFKEVLKTLPTGKRLKLRADSAFYVWDFIDQLEFHNITYAITADSSKTLQAMIEALPENRWKNYASYPGAKVAELRYAPHRKKEHRYVIKRVPATDKEGKSCFEYYKVITNDTHSTPKQIIEWALKRCGVENLIKEHKSQSGFALEKMPTQNFFANYSWLLIGQLAFNLVAWFKRSILPEHYHRSTIKTIRYHLFNLAGRIVRSGPRHFLVLSDHYFFKDVWAFAINKLAALKT